METITFYSYKGGVGRTLAVANVSRNLALLGQKVLAIDFDLEAPGLRYKLFPSQEEGPEPRLGLLDLLVYATAHVMLPESLEPYIEQVPRGAGGAGELWLMPAGGPPSAEYWRKLSSLNWHDMFYGENPFGVPLFRELQARIEEDLQPDFVLIDSRTGITEMGGVAATLLCDKLVVMVILNRENLAGARAVMRSIARIPRADDLPPPKMITVLSRLPRPQPIRVPLDPAPQAPRFVLDEAQREVLQFLNQPADDLADTLALDRLLVLRAEPSLEIEERLLLGQMPIPFSSGLRDDYLTLCRHIIDPDVLAPGLQKLVEEAEALLPDDPDSAEEALEVLAFYSPDPSPLRSLIKAQRDRPSPISHRAHSAYELWRATGDAGEPLLWAVLQDAARELGRSDQGLEADMAEAVWRAHGANDLDVAVAVAESYAHAQAPARAISVLEELADSGLTAPRMIARLVNYLLRAGREESALAYGQAHLDALRSAGASLDPQLDLLPFGVAGARLARLVLTEHEWDCLLRQWLSLMGDERLRDLIESYRRYSPNDLDDAFWSKARDAWAGDASTLDELRRQVTGATGSANA